MRAETPHRPCLPQIDFSIFKRPASRTPENGVALRGLQPLQSSELQPALAQFPLRPHFDDSFNPNGTLKEPSHQRTADVGAGYPVLAEVSAQPAGRREVHLLTLGTCLEPNGPGRLARDVWFRPRPTLISLLSVFILPVSPQFPCVSHFRADSTNHCVFLRLALLRIWRREVPLPSCNPSPHSNL